MNALNKYLNCSSSCKSWLAALRHELKRKANPEKAAILQRFFKTGPGEYAENDIFLGIVVPEQRKIAKHYQFLSRRDVLKLIRSKIHEERLIGLLILIRQYDGGDSHVRAGIFRDYLKHTEFINNWDLVDLSAPNIAGNFLFDRKNPVLLRRLARSKHLWDRRIAIISTFSFIRRGKFPETLRIAKLLLRDQHDLIHKAVGWMLREVGKRSLKTEEDFLRRYYRRMPRTMLRYAIERFPETKRKLYLKGKI
ncbi:MAG: DNA alkylation repair protein [Omnitrophica bacterium RIFCSPLOWO2_12_FULL_44_17]|uniref:DNA alkylation repair protein n=1 Tax=Candidatus Danuiimicrobium aquiferis TaxID=1801832 RepID=A0A1G1KX76_9BACT|nr:MAG: DNA alkylation repair protein [Omnitrophica bacterium RIFCSPHIGHO2_02_FULL_45_28]OGW89135.1 MAG: DNA alkylation repair protein [Omnitrophica bacterium RIFCSPHIGHO2_12_FULL_44_12]OGW97514.1 MAG: DNA alkylation repair protein [Omnitrophica bacterium RIFCSPLOWO2_12_FULL_44_17]OGX02068.1 MAG: DNA alkylation repair protein [Omnitrophica bacterium RIFCSPLOWO2_02_FULL_44_11]